jgi:hypothetical protein
MEGNMTTRVKIDRRFCGPPESGNGGYVCGRAAAFLEGDVEVTLRRPPPLGTPLDVVIHGRDRVSLSDESGLVADGPSLILLSQSYRHLTRPFGQPRPTPAFVNISTRPVLYAAQTAKLGMDCGYSPVRFPEITALRPPGYRIVPLATIPEG